MSGSCSVHTQYDPTCTVCCVARCIAECAERGGDVSRQPRLVIWRVRRLSCDGGLPGREWMAEFFIEKKAAELHLQELIAESNRRNPKIPFNTEPEVVDGVTGYCNWQFGIMLALDAVGVCERRH